MSTRHASGPGERSLHGPEKVGEGNTVDPGRPAHFSVASLLATAETACYKQALNEWVTGNQFEWLNRVSSAIK